MLITPLSAFPEPNSIIKLVTVFSGNYLEKKKSSSVYLKKPNGTIILSRKPPKPSNSKPV
jgi:hypothetical protein